MLFDMPVVVHSGFGWRDISNHHQRTYRQYRRCDEARTSESGHWRQKPDNRFAQVFLRSAAIGA
jgi:hypothetical protein